jgi:hypothetical protein
VVLIEIVILNFQEEVFLAEDFGVFAGHLAGFVVLIFEERFVDVAAEAGREADEAFGVLLKELFIDAGLVVETVEVAGGDELDEIAVAVLILGEEDEVVVAAGVGFVVVDDVEFAADDRVDAFGFGGVVELDATEEIAVIGHGNGGHLLLGCDVHELLDFAGAVEERVVGMAVEVNEGYV